MSFLKKVFPFLNTTPPKESEKQADQEALLERHQVLVENLAAALVIRNLSGEITYCSPFTEVLTGYPLKNIYDSESDFFLSVVHPADRESFERGLTLGKIGERFEMRHRFLHHSEMEMWIESRTAPLFDENGQLLASLSIMLDVTKAVRFEEQLKEKTYDLQQITAVAAEEIENEVFTLKGMNSLFGEDINEDELREALSLTSDKLNQLARGLTEFGKASVGKSELRTLFVSDVVNMFAEEQSLADVTVSVDGSIDELRVIADKEELLHVLSALADYSRSLSNPEDPPTLKIRAQKNQSEVTLFYTDSCPPIPSHLAEAIFRPKVERAAPLPIHLRGKQTPFSLSLTQKRMKRMGGGLDFRVTEEGTNCFILTLRPAFSLTQAA